MEKLEVFSKKDAVLMEFFRKKGLKILIFYGIMLKKRIFCIEWGALRFVWVTSLPSKRQKIGKGGDRVLVGGRRLEMAGLIDAGGGIGEGNAAAVKEDGDWDGEWQAGGGERRCG